MCLKCDQCVSCLVPGASLHCSNLKEEAVALNDVPLIMDMTTGRVVAAEGSAHSTILGWRYESLIGGGPDCLDDEGQVVARDAMVHMAASPLPFGCTATMDLKYLSPRGDVFKATTRARRVQLVGTPQSHVVLALDWIKAERPQVTQYREVEAEGGRITYVKAEVTIPVYQGRNLRLVRG